MNDDIKEVLDGMAAVSRFFTLSPEYLEMAQALREDIIKYEDLCGRYTTVKIIQTAEKKLEKDLIKAAALKEKHQRTVDEAQRVLDEAAHTVGLQVVKATEAAKAKLDEDQEALSGLLAEAESAKQEANNYVDTLAKQHKDREKELHDKDVALSKANDQLDMDRSTLDREVDRLRAAKEQLTGIL